MENINFSNDRIIEEVTAGKVRKDTTEKIEEVTEGKKRKVTRTRTRTETIIAEQVKAKKLPGSKDSQLISVNVLHFGFRTETKKQILIHILVRRFTSILILLFNDCEMTWVKELYNMLSELINR